MLLSPQLIARRAPSSGGRGVPSTKTLDGHASNLASTASSGTVTLSTTQANDIIVLHFAAEASAGTVISLTSVTSTSGFAWQRRSQIQLGPATMQGHANNYLTVEVWWAYAPTAVTSEVITAHINSTIDDMTLIAFGVNGCYTSAPWDPNSSLPAYNSQASGSNVSPGVTGVSTDSTKPFMFGCESNVNGVLVFTVPSGWSNIETKANGGAVLQCHSRADYAALTAQQSGASFSWTGSTASSYGLIVDALW